MRFVSIKASNVYGFLGCVILLAMAMYLQITQNLVPCPLCLIQRYIVALLGLVFLIGLAFHATTGLKIHAVILFIVSLMGALVSSRQVWLQYSPYARHVDCGPSLQYMLKNLPLPKTLLLLFQGSGECGAIEWTFLNLSMPVWTLGFFSVVCLLALYNFKRA